MATLQLLFPDGYKNVQIPDDGQSWFWAESNTIYTRVGNQFIVTNLNNVADKLTIPGSQDIYDYLKSNYGIDINSIYTVHSNQMEGIQYAQTNAGFTISENTDPAKLQSLVAPKPTQQGEVITMSQSADNPYGATFTSNLTGEVYKDASLVDALNAAKVENPWLTDNIIQNLVTISAQNVAAGGAPTAFTSEQLLSAGVPVEKAQTISPTGSFNPATTDPTSGGLTSGAPSFSQLDPSILTQITSNLGPRMNSDPTQVKILQQALVKAGYMTQAQMDTGPGIYGDYTTAAVAAWQKAVGVPTGSYPGYFGPASKSYPSGYIGGTPTSSPSIDPTQPKTFTTDTGVQITIDANGQVISDSSIDPNTGLSIEQPGTGTDTTHDLPDGILPPSMQNLAVYNLPPEAFNAMVPQLVPGTPEYQAAMDKLSTAYFDVMQQQMNAQTEQEQQAAQYNWETLKKSIESSFNITLSNDAMQAWDQIQGLKKQFAGQNIEGSGIQNEAIDSYLRKVRNSEANIRSESQSKLEAQQQDYYMKFATPEQIKAFALANPEKARAWGLVPSDAIRTAMTPAALRAKYPNMSDAEIQANIASILDENGNYRSALYQKYMVGSNVGINMGTLGPALKDENGNVISQTVNPSDTGVLDINQAKTQYQDINTPLASQLADYNARVTLGSIKPTIGDTSGVNTTLFNKIEPAAGSTTPPASNPTPTLANPITVPGSMTSTGSTSSTPPPSTLPSTNTSTQINTTGATNTFYTPTGVKIVTDANGQIISDSSKP